MDMITIKAPAKINLTLDVLGRRPNGYHDLKMIMQTIDICDTVRIQKIEQDTITFSMNKELPDGCPTEKNLVYKAADLMKKTYDISGGMDIYLEKNIPAAAGLAGGSSDCAATLIGINQLFELGLSLDKLCELGVTLGADVPFCIKKGTMLSEGIGEILTSLPDMPPIWALLIKPDISVSTAFVYQNLDLPNLQTHPETQVVLDALTHKDAAKVAKNLGNVLETVTIPNYPVIQEIKEFLIAENAVGALMSGSGPTTYGLYQDEIAARMAYKKAMDKYPDYDIVLCQTKLPAN